MCVCDASGAMYVYLSICLYVCSTTYKVLYVCVMRAYLDGLDAQPLAHAELQQPQPNAVRGRQKGVYLQDINTHAYMQTHRHTHTHTHRRTEITYTQTYTYIHTDIHSHTYLLVLREVRPQPREVVAGDVRGRKALQTRIHTNTYTHTYTHTYIHTHNY